MNNMHTNEYYKHTHKNIPRNKIICTQLKTLAHTMQTHMKTLAHIMQTHENK